MVIDFEGQAIQYKNVADSLVESGENLVVAIEDYRVTVECRIKFDLVKQGIFNEKEDTHHFLDRLAQKANLTLDPAIHSFLKDEKSFQHTKKVNIVTEGTSVAISPATWASGNSDEIERELKEKAMRCKEVCEIIWRATGNPINIT